jgi:hypothetical protein
MRTDVYEKITNQIVSELEKGVRPWHQPWKAEHAAGRITRPLRAAFPRLQRLSGPRNKTNLLFFRDSHAGIHPSGAHGEHVH